MHDNNDITGDDIVVEKLERKYLYLQVHYEIVFTID